MYFTVCIPTYNRKEKLKLALQSLERQSYKNFEVIVVDDGSIDNTKNFVLEYLKKTTLNLRYIFKDNGGKHTALNIGIEAANGKYFIILDSDDIFSDNCLKYFFDKTTAIDNDEKFCGIICRCAEMKDNNVLLIGEKFPKEKWVTSYIDFHFGNGLTIYGSRYKDCCECVKTKIIKEYRFPEIETAKFIPESYVFDQIGLSYNLLAFNEILEIKEYQDTGITKNFDDYKKKNIDGFLLKYKWNVENLARNPDIKLLAKFVIWYQYFNALDIKKNQNKKHSDDIKIPFILNCLKVILPLLKKLRNLLRR